LPWIARTDQGVHIRNCEEPRNEDARRVCPDPFCEKALRDNGEIDDHSFVQVSGVTHPGHSNLSTITGYIKMNAVSEQPTLFFYCQMDGDRVIQSEIMQGEEWMRRLNSGEFDNPASIK